MDLPVALIGHLGQRGVLKPIEQVVPEAALEGKDVGGSVGDSPADDRFRQIVNIGVADNDPAGCGPGQPAESLSKRLATPRTCRR